MHRIGYVLAFAAGSIVTFGLTSSPRSTQVRSLQPNGAREEYTLDRDGLIDGEFRSYHPNGRLAIVQKYSHGVATDSSQHFDESGEPLDALSVE